MKKLKLRVIYRYIKSDAVRCGIEPKLSLILLQVFLRRDFGFVYCFWLRMSVGGGIIGLLAKIMREHYSLKYGFHIHWKTKIGYGLSLGHGYVVVNPTAEIGDNCNLAQFTTIGSNYGKAAKIGNNVYIGPSVCIVEDVSIGDNVTIGAGSVVVKDIPENATVAGVPARVLNYNNSARFIKNKFNINISK